MYTVTVHVYCTQLYKKLYYLVQFLYSFLHTAKRVALSYCHCQEQVVATRRTICSTRETTRRLPESNRLCRQRWNDGTSPRCAGEYIQIGLYVVTRNLRTKRRKKAYIVYREEGRGY